MAEKDYRFIHQAGTMKIKVVQVGIGGFGKTWLTALKENERVQVVGLVDMSPEALESAKKFLGFETPCFVSLGEALDTVKPDFLVCVVPPALHKEVAVAAMRRGVHVLSEKPFADSPGDCLEMLDVMRETGRVLAISQNYRYRPVATRLVESIRSGLIGKVGQVKCDFYLGNDFGGGFRLRMDYPLIVDMAIHHLDLARAFTGLNAVRVQGGAWNPPWSNYQGDASSSLLFEMEGGCRFNYNASWCAKGQFGGWDGQWLIEGSEGSLAYDGEKITLRKAPDLYRVVETSELHPADMKKTNQAFVLDDFLDALEEGRLPQTHALDNIHSISMVFAAVEAVKTGNRVPVLSDSIQKLFREKNLGKIPLEKIS